MGLFFFAFSPLRARSVLSANKNALMHDARGEALRRGAASRRAAAASSAESTMRCIHRASRRQRDAQPQLGRRSVRVEGPSDTKHRLKFSVQRSAQHSTWYRVILKLYKFAWQTFSAFQVCYPLLFEATMPRRYARSDVRGSDTTSVDIQNHYPR